MIEMPPGSLPTGIVLQITYKPCGLAYISLMPPGFNVYRKLENGEIVRVAWRADRTAAEDLLRELQETFPGEYGIETAEGKPVWVRNGPKHRWES